MSWRCPHLYDFPICFHPGASIKLGRGTILRFNHPSEAAELKEKHQVQTTAKLYCVLILLCCFCETEEVSFRKDAASTSFSLDNFVKASEHHQHFVSITTSSNTCYHCSCWTLAHTSCYIWDKKPPLWSMQILSDQNNDFHLLLNCYCCV